MAKQFKELGVEISKSLVGTKIDMADVFDKEITVHDFRIALSKYPKQEGDLCLHLQFELEGKMRVAFTISKSLMETVQRIPETDRPFTTTIKKQYRKFIFT